MNSEQAESTLLSRITSEKNDLDEKILKLSDALSKKMPDFIGSTHFELMRQQLVHMKSYRSIIQIRIIDIG